MPEPIKDGVTGSPNPNPDGEEGTTQTPTIDPPEPDNGDDSSNGKPSTEEPKFTKKELDAAAASARRAEREKIKREQDEAQGEFKTLYEEELRKSAEIAKALLVRDICDELEIPKDWRDSVNGADEEAIRASAESLKARLDKIAEDALKANHSKSPGTPPPVEGGGNGDDAKKKGLAKTRKAVYDALGVGQLLQD